MENPIDTLTKFGADESRLVLGTGSLTVLGESDEQLDGNIYVGGINLSL